MKKLFGAIVLVTLILYACTLEKNDSVINCEEQPASTLLPNSYKTLQDVAQYFPFGYYNTKLMENTQIVPTSLRVLQNISRSLKYGEIHSLEFEQNGDIIYVKFGKTEKSDTMLAHFIYMDSLKDIDWNVIVQVWRDDNNLPHEEGYIYLDNREDTKIYYEAAMKDSQSMFVKYEFPYYNYSISGVIYLYDEERPAIADSLVEFFRGHQRSFGYFADINSYVIDYAVGEMVSEASNESKAISSKWLSWGGGIITGIAVGYVVGPVAGTIAGAVYSAINTYVN